ncbi:peptidylprolyl isomerase [Sorangium sp. So ce1389]|uniref:peptidylprolyl isomerase n=1 Tax=Sorangium sp. So ce1389 TaxID=3133336 RepID=UPI003F5F1847
MTLRIAHILIRHQDIESSKVSLSMLEWTTEYPPARRSRIAAWQLAESIAERARKDPSTFAELARDVSEDPTTRDQGGDLGFVMASQLWNWPHVLDALAATAEGGVSPVVETEQGFHVFLRRAPPAARRLSGARILLSHRDAPFPSEVAVLRKPVARSRDEAKQLAEELHRRLRLEPSGFQRFASEYSDHLDAERGGDFGTWSNREPTPLSRQVATLDRLQIGEIAPPLETLFGIEIIMRTEDRPRSEYAAGTLQFPFHPQNPASKLEAAGAAERAAALLKSEPALFEKMQRERQSERPLHVVSGRDTQAVEDALARLEPGQVSPEPVLSSTRYLLLKRLDLSVLPPVPPPRTELPSPTQMDLADMVRNAQPAFLRTEFQSIAQQASALPGLGKDAVRELVRLHETGATFTGLAPDERVRAFQRLDAEIERLLGAVAHQQYRALAHAQLERALMTQR